MLDLWGGTGIKMFFLEGRIGTFLQAGRKAGLATLSFSRVANIHLEPRKLMTFKPLKQKA